MRCLHFSGLCVLIGLSSFAQNSNGLNELIQKIESPTKSPNQTDNLEFHKSNFNQTFEDVSIFKKNENSYAIKANNESSVVLLSKNEGVIKGILLNKSKDVGYKISSNKNGDLKYTSTPKSELLFVCDFQKNTTVNKKKTRNYIGNSKTESEVLKLESKPNSHKLIYLDFDSEPSLPDWNYSYVPSNYTNAKIKTTWESVSEDFLAFDVNITTNRALFDATPVIDRGWVVFADFQNNSWGGVAYVGSYGTGAPVLVDGGANGSVSNFTLMAASHELGHAFGLSHDAKSGGGGYYAGHGEFSPIMGNGSRPVSHWSNGDYSGATNNEDDMDIIAQETGFRQDDFLTSKNLFVLVNDSVLPQDNFGMIENRADVDTFNFETFGYGLVELEFKSPIKQTNLDILIKVFDDAGTLITQVNPVGQREVLLSENLTSGKYQVTIEGDGELGPTDGFSDYSSFGFYQIRGKIHQSKLANHDIVGLQLLGSNIVCNKLFSPEIEVLNNGLNTITSYSVEVIIDGITDHTETINTNLISGAKESVQLDPISNFGNHNVEFIINMGSAETVLYNNQINGSYELKDGNMIEFSTNLDVFSGSGPITWKIMDQNNSEIISSQVLSTISDGVTISQEYCIPNGCYDIEISGGFNLCEGITKYNNSSVYLLDDEVFHQGSVYKAKWWTQGTPPPAQQWTLIGTCNEGPYQYALNDLYHSSELISGSSSSFTSGATESFCIDVITNAEENNFDLGLKVYPNPSKKNFTINTDISGMVEIINNLGQTISAFSTEGKIEYSISDPGFYWVRFSNKNNVEVVSIIISH